MTAIKTVLIIEDDPYNRELEKTLFERNGYTVVEAEDEKPDVILLDWQLPNIDGLQALQILQNSPNTKNIPA